MNHCNHAEGPQVIGTTQIRGEMNKAAQLKAANKKLSKLEPAHIALLHELGRIKAVLRALDNEKRRAEKYENEGGQT